MIPKKEHVDVTIITDGASSGNPGPSGYAAIIQINRRNSSIEERIISGGFSHSTNNVSELTAVLEGIRCLTEPSNITIVTDSANVIGWLASVSVDKSLKTFKRNDSRIADLAVSIENALCSGGHLLLGFTKVHAHSGHRLNERVDKLAKSEIAKIRVAMA
ncbi:ribonuclease HI [bacterium]|nr:ribonuclease HI [bacterium]